MTKDTLKDLEVVMSDNGVLTAVISSVITAAIIFIGGRALGLYEVVADEATASEVAKQLVTNDTLSPLLLQLMANNGEFVGPQGDQGPKGETGPVGPRWLPTGGITLVANDSGCPGGSQRIANFAAQVSRSGELYRKTIPLAEADTSWDVSRNWDGLIFTACHFK
ncbi:hypothetical protein So717_43250 [Roseobacter cerasinus]|uniref:Uncharacterized protein n=1 Tax=Roseobacter cerasinus TaxID=2602289 RepID=A0A640VY12_9RHOB|nr:hypothetical protein [Roseobacter cerasinus]GFE52572.1 hypothetical protein So717_43250 [Roseobacter cerasinus]